MAGNIHKALPHYLKANAGIISVDGARVFPDKLPQGTILPATVYQLISTNPIQTHGERSFLPRQRFQLTYYGGTYETCDIIANAFKSALDGYRGTMGTGAFETEIEFCLFKDERTVDETELVVGIFWRQHDYMIGWKE